MRSTAAAVPLPAEQSRVRTVLRHDLPASAVVVLIAIPLSLGIAVASGAPVMAGLIAAAVGGIVAGLLGGCRLQVSGPAAGLTVVVADLVAKYGWGVMCAITAAAGLLQMMFGISRVARAALAISPSVVHAMLAGIGITITLGQLHVLLGGAPGDDAITNIAELPGQIADVHYPAVVLGLIVIAVVLIWPRLPSPMLHIPAPLVAVVGATALATMLAVDLERVMLPGSVLDAVSLPEVPGGSWGGVLLGVLTVAVIASVESLLSAVAVDKLSGAGATNFDRELVGQGAANTLSGMLGGLPVTGVIVRSSANVAAGARTRVSAVAHGVWVLAFAVLFVELIELIPMAVLAGLLVVIGVRLVKLADLRCAHKHGELAIYLVTLAGVVLLNLLAGVLIGLGLSLVTVLRRTAWSGVHVQRVSSGSWRVVVAGTVCFLSIPRLSRMLAQVPRGSHVVVEMVADFLDHAAREHLIGWRQQHEAAGGTVVVDEIESAHRNGVTGNHRQSASAVPTEDRPRVLFFTCADSPVAPQQITGLPSGEVFTVRNIGHLVPPSDLESGSSVAASLEYAVNHLAVPSIVVCGHSCCTAMHGLLDGTVNGSLGSWLRWGLPSLHALRAGHPVGVAAAEDGCTEADQLAMVNVACQVEVIGRHSAIRDAVAAGRVQVIGVFVDTNTGRLLRLDHQAAGFRPAPIGCLPTPVEDTRGKSEQAGTS
jgi:carbonic anhydrase